MKQLFLILLFFCFFVSAIAQQASVSGFVLSESGTPLESVSVVEVGKVKGTITNSKGFFKLNITPEKETTLAFSYIGYSSFQQKIKLKAGEQKSLKINLKKAIQLIDEFEITEETNRNTSMQKLNPKDVSAIPSASGNFEALLFSQAGVSSNNELSSQYSVRGGNFDENLVYVNNIQVYRPQLIRSGQQEGLSFINSDMVSNVLFSAGGFEAKYGDKMSSVLDIKYKEPEKFESTIKLGLLGASAYIGSASKNHRFTQIHGARYKTNKLVLSSLDSKGNYNPAFFDYQGYFTYDVTDDLELHFLTNIATNKYKFIPATRKSEFGTINQALQLTVFFNGQEVDQFNTYMGAFSAEYTPTINTKLEFITSSFTTHESETFDILGQYRLNELDRNLGSSNFGNVAFNRGAGTFLNHGRNFFNANVFNIKHIGSTKIKKLKILWGANYQHEIIRDAINEWEMIDSSGFSIPQAPTDVVQLSQSFASKNNLSSDRTFGYVQGNYRYLTKDTALLTFSGGVRYNYWTLNKELLISPRLNVSYRPHWEKDFLFKASWGYYQQPAFYKEFRNFQGVINRNIQAQVAVHYIFTSDYNFKMWGRPFKLINNIYYKNYKKLIPYEINNVRLRYFGTNNSHGYTVGADAKINGEFAKGVDSWASISVLQTKEDITDDFYVTYFNDNGEKIIPGFTVDQVVADSVVTHPGYIPRPTDQLVNFGMFFQDYIPKHPNYKMHLNLLYGAKLPTGPPTHQRYKDTLRIPAYRRVDIGFSAQLLGGNKKVGDKHLLKNFKSIWISVEVFNLLQINNTISYLWIKDVTNRQFAIPNFLTSRRLNIKMIFKF